MKKEQREPTKQFGIVTLFVSLAFLCLLSQEASSNNDLPTLLGTTKTNILTKIAFQKKLGVQTAFKTTPEFYKLNTVLTDGSKVHFKKSIEQDLYFYFGPYIKDKQNNKKGFNPKFNKVLRDLFKFHF